MNPTENKKTIHFKQRLLPNILPHDLEIVTVNRGESTSQYHTPLAVAKFTRKWEKIKSRYFIATHTHTYIYIYIHEWYTLRYFNPGEGLSGLSDNPD